MVRKYFINLIYFIFINCPVPNAPIYIHTSELESSAYAALRQMILFLRSSLSHEQRSGKYKGGYRLFSYRVGR